MNLFAIFYVGFCKWLAWFPEYGVLGAALGNGLSFAIGAVLLVVFWLSNQLAVRYSSIFDLDIIRVIEIFKVGLPST